MRRNILTILATLGLLAVAPSAASASPVLQESGSTLAGGSTVGATNNGNFTFTTSAGNIECTLASLTGTLVANTGSLIEINIGTTEFKGTESEGRCSGPLGATAFTFPSLPWCIKTTKTSDQFEWRGGKCTEASRAVTSTLDTTLAGACSYSRSNVLGTVTTGGAQAQLTVSAVEFTKTGGGFGCPSSTKVDATLQLETLNGTALQIN